MPENGGIIPGYNNFYSINNLIFAGKHTILRVTTIIPHQNKISSIENGFGLIKKITSPIANDIGFREDFERYGWKTILYRIRAL